MTLLALNLDCVPVRTAESAGAIDKVRNGAMVAIATATRIAILLVPILFAGARHVAINNDGAHAVAPAVLEGARD